MLTADTFDPNVHAHTNDLHFVAAARMRLFHLYDVSQAEYFAFQPGHPPRLLCRMRLVLRIRRLLRIGFFRLRFARPFRFRLRDLG